MLAQQFADNNFSAVWAVTELTPRPGPVSVHPRINRTLRLIPGRLEALQDVSLKTLADLSGLSTSRFMHLFTEAAGVPLRQYILRLRLQRACVELLAGTTVTLAACSAGFSDASHLTKTFRRMLGVTPTALFPRNRSSVADQKISRNRPPEPDKPAIRRTSGDGSQMHGVVLPTQ
jgi:AraC-like DNA-binding protein